MNKYEITFIINPTLEEATIKNVAKDMESILTKKKAKIIESKELGQKTLAYEIKKHNKGYYFLILVEATSDAIKEFDRLALINENVIRHLIINLDK